MSNPFATPAPSFVPFAAWEVETVKTFKFLSSEGGMAGALVNVVKPAGKGMCLVRFVGKQPPSHWTRDASGCYLVEASEVAPV